ncbi:MAG: MMPL family transporter [Deltaproteobacteria bacterium]|nr:MMPL family transporter [Deltaproteobacteria bacterium]
MTEPIEASDSKLAGFITRHKTLVIILALVFTLGVGSGIRKIQTEVILSDLFPLGHPYLQLMGEFSEIFGGFGSGVIIGVNAKDGDIFNEKILTKIRDMTLEIELWDEVYRLQTFSMASNAAKVVRLLPGGEIRSEALMFPEVPKTAEKMEQLKTNVFTTPSYDGIMVARDGTAAVVQTSFKENISYEAVFAKMQDLKTRYEDENTTLHILGFPMLMGWIYSFQYQMYLVFAVSVALMIAILYFIFRNAVGIIAPMTMLAICTLLGLGFTGWIQMNFSPLLYVLAFLVGARMISNSVQITHRYLEELQITCDVSKATQNTIAAMWKPNAAAVMTDAVGFSVLAVAKIVLMQQLAVIMSFWMLTIGLSGILVPVICSLVPTDPEKLTACEPEEAGWLGRLNMWLANFSIGSGKVFIGLLAVAIVGVGVWQVTNLKVGDPTPGSSILWPDQQYNRDTALMNEKFQASSEDFTLYFEGKPNSVYEPAVLKTFEEFSDHMLETLPDIYKSSDSIINFVEAVNFQFRDGDPLRYQTPSNLTEMTGVLGMLKSTIGMAVLGLYMDPPMQRAQLVLFFADHTSDNILRIRDAAYGFFEDRGLTLSDGGFETEYGKFLLAGGAIGMEIALNEEMRRTHAQMDVLVLLAIFVMCSIAFRSAIAGLMLAIPLILSNLIAFTYMAIADVGLTTNTLPCSAVGVGVGVDFAIYLYSRCKEEFGPESTYKDTVMTAVRTAGKGIVFTGVTLILPLVLWYYISGLKFQAQMGFFLSMLLFTNMVAAFTLHPLLICTIKPKFLQQNRIFPRIKGDT